MKTFVNSSLLVVLLLLVSNLFLSSCSKDKDDSETVPVPLIATIDYYNGDGTLRFLSSSIQYDNQGRQIKLVHPRDYSIMTEYSGSTVIIKNYTGSRLEDTSIVPLNSKGLCASTPMQNSVERVTNNYDSDGYLKLIFYKGNNLVYTKAFTVSEGNYVTEIIIEKRITNNLATIKEVDLLESSFLPINPEMRMALKKGLKSAVLDSIVYNSKYEYQFYKDKLNTTQNENMGLSFYGKQNKNPIKQVTITRTGNTFPTTIETFTYTYEYDNKGRITKVVIDNGDYTIYTYVD